MTELTPLPPPHRPDYLVNNEDELRLLCTVDNGKVASWLCTALRHDEAFRQAHYFTFRQNDTGEWEVLVHGPGPGSVLVTQLVLASASSEEALLEALRGHTEGLSLDEQFHVVALNRDEKPAGWDIVRLNFYPQPTLF